MLVLLILHLVAALLAPLLVRWWGPRACYPLAVAPAAAFGWALTRTPTVRAGDALVETRPWVRQLQLDLALRMTTLSWLMVLLIGGVGALVLVYCAGYLAPDEPGLGRFVGVLVAFAGAMLGLVLADNLLLLYVCWELTTVCSYLLIGHHPERRAARWAAAQALTVTTLGGLAMLVGFVLLAERTGTYRWSEITATPPAGGYLTVAVLLILTGALAKSAVLPFSGWLRTAMAAPTPVSAYLHAAAMVKAGVYLVALLSPVLAHTPPWRPVTTVAGLATLVVGGWAALRQTDLKLLLAYGTISQLGLLVAVTGAGTRTAALAGSAMLLAHALFKSALFLVVGAVEHATGTRDLRELTGLRRRLPLLAVVATLAAASMAGAPPLFGFVAKEAVLYAVADEPLTLTVVVVGSAFTVAYSARFLWGAFADRPGVPVRPVHRPAWALVAPPALLAGAGLLLAPLAGPVGSLLAPYAERFPGVGHGLALWAGVTPALGWSVVVLAGGAALFLGLLRRDIPTPLVTRLRLPGSEAGRYERVTHVFDRAAVEVTARIQRGSLPQYLGTVLAVLVALPGSAVLLLRPWPLPDRLWDGPAQLVVAVVVAVAAVLAVAARRRLTAMLLVGVTGYGSSMIFVLHGAPDLALTQILVETATIVLFVLALRRLPPRFSARPHRRSRWARRAIGVSAGVVLAALAAAAVAHRRAPPVSVDFPRLAVEEAYGRNVVNVTLVDLRAWDTLGEIAVLVVAATGVASLVFERSRGARRPRRRGAAGPPLAPGQRVWLRGGPTLSERSRALVLEVITRVLFHSIVVFSLFLLFSGHNAPGGGFAGGLVAGLGLGLRYLAGGRYELEEAAPVGAGTVLGAGLGLAVGSGVVALLVLGDLLGSARIEFSLPGVGDGYLVTSLFFDVGVYLVVVGLALDVLRSLGAEVDRQVQTGGDGVGALAADRREERP
ncbi:Na+/H+ antiporter subunit A [Micromonospora sp. WMMD882]|uniref:Na+/H+ antiporter subunit A n=1 Tax=Micromonospora sp. WMMD882 TaxID=3015151 RepID=UPI00248BF506|nr:Na+/H+ antiporter subunit A [Micromonospora sp. WMMD882]WBB81829.1 Na+/H+ antiporter subunit A [Micromonospora sp. WMMD882]